MANAVPVHKDEPKKPAPKAEPAPKSDVQELPYHPVVKPGNHYKLPDGTVVRDN